MIVTTIPWLPSVTELVQEVNDARITIHTIDGRGKRPALVKGIQQARTPVVAPVDDHIIWSPDTLHGLLSGLLESRDVGGVTPIKNNRSTRSTALGAIAATRLDRRSMANAAMAHFANGQVIVCSGKTSAYRTEILQDPKFIEYFTQDLWMNKYPLVSGDDVAITYWLYQNGWKTGFASQDECAITSQQVAGSTRVHLEQVLRWARNRIRWILRDMGNIVSRSSPLWYRMLSFRSIAFPVMTEDYFLIPDSLTVLFVLFVRTRGGLGEDSSIPSTLTVILHYLGLSALLELASSLWHFYRCPQSLWQLPVLPFWGHVRMAVTVYGILTPNQVRFFFFTVMKGKELRFIVWMDDAGWGCLETWLENPTRTV